MSVTREVDCADEATHLLYQSPLSAELNQSCRKVPKDVFVSTRQQWNTTLVTGVNTISADEASVSLAIHNGYLPSEQFCRPRQHHRQTGRLLR